MVIFKSTQTAQKVGQDLVVCIDDSVARAAGLVAGQKVLIEVVNEGILIRSTAASKESLDQKLARFDPILHGGEIMAVQPLGHELF